MPEVHISTLAINGSHWLESSFTCYSYNNWAAADELSGLQPFIWATNPQVPVRGPLEEARLAAHQYYGRFTFDMQQAGSQTNTPMPPSIDFAKANDEVKDGSFGDSNTPSSFSELFPLHGFLLTLATLVLYPAGAIAIRNGSKKAFQIHIFLQLAATALCFVGSVIASFCIGINRMVIQNRILNIQPVISVLSRKIQCYRLYVRELLTRIQAGVPSQSSRPTGCFAHGPHLGSNPSRPSPP